MIQFTDGDLRNVMSSCEHSLAVVELQARFGGDEEKAYFIQRRAAMATLQAKAEQELMVRAKAASEAEEKRVEEAEAKLEADLAKQAEPPKGE